MLSTAGRCLHLCCQPLACIAAEGRCRWTLVLTCVACACASDGHGSEEHHGLAPHMPVRCTQGLLLALSQSARKRVAFLPS